jgi:uncharacterized membrane protein YhaH (DUF805 family)
MPFSLVALAEGKLDVWIVHSIILVAIVMDVRLSASGHKERAVLTGLYLLAAALPALASYVRTLHDTDHSGSWFFTGAIPLVGQLVLLRPLIKAGDSGPNRLGAIPKADSLAVAPSEVGSIPPPLGRNGC